MKYHLILPAALGLIGAANAAIVVTPTGVTTSTVPTPGDTFPVGNLINNSGLSTTPVTEANYTTVTHANGSASTAWVTVDVGSNGGDYFVEGNANPVLTFDLGGTFDLTNFLYWGYFNGGTVNEAKSFTLSFSTTGVGGTFSGDQLFNQTTARGTGTAGDFALAPVTANAVRITITDNFNGDRVGLGEVKFLAVPEPSVALLGGLSLLGLLRRRRA